MRGLQRGRIATVVVSALIGAAVEATLAAEPEQSLQGFSCRASEIYGGQHDTGAVVDVTPGNPNPLRFFRVRKGGAGIDVIVPRDSSFLAGYTKIWAGLPGRLPYHFYWSASDDFIVWPNRQLWLWRGDSIVAGARPEYELLQIHPSGHLYSLDDVVPEHIEYTARLAGYDMRRYLLEFNLRSRIFWQLPISVYPQNGLAWTANDRFLRVRHHIVKDNIYLDIFDATAQQWVEFSPQRLPPDAKLLMFRLNPRDKNPEAIISWRDRRNVDHVGSITRSAAAPNVLDSGEFAHIHVSPDRMQLMGVTEESGRFHRVKGEPYSPRVSFWLARFEKMSGIEKFYLQDNARYAFIKVNDPTAGTEIAVWERKGDEVQRIGKVCSTK